MRLMRNGTAATFRGVRARALVVLGAVAILTLALGAGLASADSGREHRDAEMTFTKWITGPGPAPIVASMAGVVGGDVGDGTFTGEVLTLVDNPLPDGTRVIDAAYHFNGALHSFSAAVHVVATGHATGDTAVLTGRVTDGWLKGNQISAEYTQGPCTHDGLTTTCFQGTLNILRGTKSVGHATAFHLDKTCADDASEPLGFFCTVEHSDFKWIPAGTEIHYAAGPADNAQFATIEIANGSTTGVCTWSSDVNAICVFGSGTGRLTQFNLEVVVTANADQSVWYWDGTYSFGN